jgi:hypothetical protein
LDIHVDEYKNFKYSSSLCVQKTGDQYISVIVDDYVFSFIDVYYDENDVVLFQGSILPHYRNRDNETISLSSSYKYIQNI